MKVGPRFMFEQIVRQWIAALFCQDAKLDIGTANRQEIDYEPMKNRFSNPEYRNAISIVVENWPRIVPVSCSLAWYGVAFHCKR